MDCDKCEHQKNKIPSVSAYEHEADMIRAEQYNKHLFVICIILCVMLIASWVGFYFYERQFETVTETVTTTTTNSGDVMQEASGGSNNYVGGDYYGSAAD